MMTQSKDQNILATAIEYGLDKIRCSLTGKVIATLDSEAMYAAIQYEQFVSPFDSAEKVLDTLETRWLIQSSRPAPHLTNQNGFDGFLFLRTYYPLDLFALLATRLVFENVQVRRESDSSELRLARLQWMVELQKVLDSKAIQLDVIDQLIRIDAIHNSRHAFYVQEIKDQAKRIRENEFNLESLINFIDNVESSGFHALASMKTAPQGNKQALSAAIATATPEELKGIEERTKREETNRRIIASINGNNAAKSGKVVVHRGFKPVVALASVSEVLPQQLAERYRADLAKKGIKVNEEGRITKGKPKSQGSKKTSASASRFDLSALDVEF